SSGSRASDKAVNPTRSAKRTVTSRRSPSSDRDAVTVATAPGSTEGTRRAPTGAGRATSSFLPHLGQKAKSAWTADPHPGQIIGGHSLLHVLLPDSPTAASLAAATTLDRRASRQRSALCTIGLHCADDRHRPLKETASRCFQRLWAIC